MSAYVQYGLTAFRAIEHYHNIRLEVGNNENLCSQYLDPRDIVNFCFYVQIFTKTSAQQAARIQQANLLVLLSPAQTQQDAQQKSLLPF